MKEEHRTKKKYGVAMNFMMYSRDRYSRDCTALLSHVSPLSKSICEYPEATVGEVALSCYADHHLLSLVTFYTRVFGVFLFLDPC